MRYPLLGTQTFKSIEHSRKMHPSMTEARAMPRPALLPKIRSELRRSNKWAYVFIAPLLIDFLIFTVYLVIRVAAMSFQDISFGQVTWVGLQHFQEVLGDPQFWNAMKNTTLFTLAV